MHMSEVTACVHKGGGIHSLDTSIRAQTTEVQQKLAKVMMMDQKHCMLQLQQEIIQVRQRDSEREYGIMNAAADKAFNLSKSIMQCLKQTLRMLSVAKTAVNPQLMTERQSRR